jgi:hypothetical protein
MALCKTGEICFLGDDGCLGLAESYQDEDSGEVTTQQTVIGTAPETTFDTSGAETIDFVETKGD